MKNYLNKIKYKSSQIIRTVNEHISKQKISYGLIPNSWLNDNSLISTECPIVIGGCGRSGTTLLSVMLNAHSDIYCPSEYPLLLKSGINLSKLSMNLNIEINDLKKNYYSIKKPYTIP